MTCGRVSGACHHKIAKRGMIEIGKDAQLLEVAVCDVVAGPVRHSIELDRVGESENATVSITDVLYLFVLPKARLRRKAPARSHTGGLLHLEGLVELSELRSVLCSSPSLFLLEPLARPDVRVVGELVLLVVGGSWLGCCTPPSCRGTCQGRRQGRCCVLVSYRCCCCCRSVRKRPDMMGVGGSRCLGRGGGMFPC